MKSIFEGNSRVCQRSKSYGLGGENRCPEYEVCDSGKGRSSESLEALVSLVRVKGLRTKGECLGSPMLQVVGNRDKMLN